VSEKKKQHRTGRVAHGHVGATNEGITDHGEEGTLRDKHDGAHAGGHERDDQHEQEIPQGLPASLRVQGHHDHPGQGQSEAELEPKQPLINEETKTSKELRSSRQQ